MWGNKNSGTTRYGLLGSKLEWDAGSEKGRQKNTLWGGSKDQGKHRRGESTPSSRNGSRSPQARKGGWFS